MVVLTQPFAEGVVWSVAFSPDGKRLASGSNDSTIKLWGLPEGKLLENLIGHERGVRSVVFRPDGNMISSSADKTIKLWSLPKE
ncbi:WD40 repeat domain-containing protein [Nostoc sp.]|uniref:WD40 repeat domain-containing protein n=1 Tax=Nostoc sp. TaxID=1180 RepID=UPI002FF874E2